MFKNYAGRSDVDEQIADELREAGIEVNRLPDCFRDRHPEMRTVVIGSLYRWSFKRNWRYWFCEGPGIEYSAATRLHEQFGKVVRVDGDCGCPSPLERFKGLAVGHYHVDSQAGLNALADTIREIVDAATPVIPGERRLIATR